MTLNASHTHTPTILLVILRWFSWLHQRSELFTCAAVCGLWRLHCSTRFKLVGSTINPRQPKHGCSTVIGVHCEGVTALFVAPARSFLLSKAGFVKRGGFFKSNTPPLPKKCATARRVTTSRLLHFGIIFQLQVAVLERLQQSRFRLQLKLLNCYLLYFKGPILYIFFTLLFYIYFLKWAKQDGHRG